ncbi:hypothetical protein HD554DRAFT_2140588 [Boletus coccyginus]|nr:hypothetical protein HD554DRAFT_2140588 [Boletus coccyginus]
MYTQPSFGIITLNGADGRVTHGSESKDFSGTRATRTCRSPIGTLLAKALRDFSDQTTLVVCYTDHALDQSSPSNPLQTNLNERYVRSIAERTVINKLKTGAMFLRAEPETKFKGFLASGVFCSLVSKSKSKTTSMHCKFPCPVLSDRWDDSRGKARRYISNATCCTYY